MIMIVLIVDFCGKIDLFNFAASSHYRNVIFIPLFSTEYLGCYNASKHKKGIDITRIPTSSYTNSPQL